MDPEEFGRPLWRAGESAPAGTYLRVDDRSYRVVVLEEPGTLPASCDGHVAWYCQAVARERTRDWRVLLAALPRQQKEASL